MSSDKQTPNKPNQTSSIESDIAELTALVASTKTFTAKTNGDRTGDPEAVDGEEIGDLGTEEVEELIRRLEAANSIAEGVEGKLDGMLVQLDGLLSSLGARGKPKENGGPTDPQPDR